MRLQKLLGTFLVAAVIFAGCSNDADKHKHSWSTEYASDATIHWIKCSGCAEIKDKSVHTAAVLSRNETNHWKVCEVCSKEYETAEHNFGNWQEVTAATEEAEGSENRVCYDCGYEETRAIPQLNHTHKFAIEWTAGETTHWHAATCGHNEKSEETAHSTAAELSKDQTNHWKVCDVCGGNYEVTVHTEDTGTVTLEPTCTEKGVKTYKCAVCEEVLRTEEISEKGHLNTTGLSKDETGHWKVCDVCGGKYEVTAHTEDEGTVTTAVTLTSDGVRTYRCKSCDFELRTEVITKPVLYESPVDAETGLAATSSSTYIYFGVFPKTVLPETSDVTVDETVSVSMGANTYYTGSDGNWYAKVKENCYDSSCTYTDGTTVKQSGANSNRYFKVEPIKWKVLTKNYNSSNKALLLAEDIITANVQYYEDRDSNRNIDEKTVYPNNYKHSQMRAYLNGLPYQGQSNEITLWNNNGFLQTAFTTIAQALIAETEVDNSADSTGTSGPPNCVLATNYACENTTDKIFLLSEKEATKSAYGFPGFTTGNTGGNARIRVATDYARANYALQYSAAGCYWLLRSPCWENSYLTYWVSNSGPAGGNLNFYDS